MKKYLLLAASVMVFTACQKETPQPTTPAPDPCPTGTIQFINNSNNPYDVYLNNTFQFTQNGRTSRDWTVDKGFYKATVKQKSGYLISPTIQDYEGTIDGCDKNIVSYP